LLAGDINKVLDAYGKMVENMLVSTGQVLLHQYVEGKNANDMTTGAKSRLPRQIRIAALAEEMSQTINDIAKNASSASEISATQWTWPTRQRDRSGSCSNGEQCAYINPWASPNDRQAQH